ncbi:hypothetical protein [Reinekea sp. G2M2-21]|uniref:hypothetical protein n=1 Tax=Reinekea sp. G2M2-21 TaxID=2788942 RepID=UPI0018AA42B2|nr:hypothetical protein [Reinekea sp. G2M2-21]
MTVKCFSSEGNSDSFQCTELLSYYLGTLLGPFLGALSIVTISIALIFLLAPDTEHDSWVMEVSPIQHSAFLNVRRLVTAELISKTSDVVQLEFYQGEHDFPEYQNILKKSFKQKDRLFFMISDVLSPYGCVLIDVGSPEGAHSERVDYRLTLECR